MTILVSAATAAKKRVVQFVAFVTAFTFLSHAAFGQRGGDPDAEAAKAAAGCSACCGGSLVVIVLVVGFIVAMIALNIALLIWVARDAKARGMDSSVIWMLFVFFTGLLGLIIYIFARPQGELKQCVHCKGKRLVASAKCPHCGNA